MTKSTADKINYVQVFLPGEDENGIPYEESLDWLEQFYPARSRAIETDRRVILLVGRREEPTQIWSMKNNYYKGTCYLEWEEEPANEDDPN